MPYADLHIHTYFSDGTQSPEEVAAAAKEKGLRVISVCDHDNVHAYARLQLACERADIALVQGAEIDVLWEDTRLHLLAYAFDPADVDMAALLRESRAELDHISVDMIAEMEKAGEPVSLAAYTAYDMPLGRGGWKGLNYLYDMGLTDSIIGGMAFHKRFGQYQPRFYPFEEACRVIRRAGGIPVLAHPGVYWLDMEKDGAGNARRVMKGDVVAKLGTLRTLGLGGVECHYPWHDHAFTALCADFCLAHGLCITCGGDGHGDFNRVVDGVIHDIGVLDVPLDKLRLDGIFSKQDGIFTKG